MRLAIQTNEGQAVAYSDLAKVLDALEKQRDPRSSW
jgi:hypothetical protein